MPDVRIEEAMRSGMRVRRFRTVGPDDPIPQDAGSVAAFPADTSVAVVGLSDNGLATALAFRQAGVRVAGVDFSRERLAQISSGRVSLPAPGRQQLREALVDPDFGLSAELRAITSSDVVVICVPTALDAHMLPDLAPLANACADVVRLARAGQLIILTSTTYAGTTTDLLVRPLESLGFRIGVDVNVAFSPERLGSVGDRPSDEMPPRIVGGATAACVARAQRVLAGVCSQVHCVSTTEAAEMTRLLENTFRAVNIALVNEFSSACHELGVEPMEVIDAAATNPGGFTRFTPGPGVGGHSLPYDPYHLTWQMRRYRRRMPVVESAMNAIADRPAHVVARIQTLLSEAGVATRSARVLVVGVAYKPNVGDTRESSAIEIVSRLASMGVDVEVADCRVAALPLPGGTVVPVQQLGEADVAAYDVVLVHTLHDDEDLAPLRDARVLLDATYQLDVQPHRVTL